MPFCSVFPASRKYSNSPFAQKDMIPISDEDFYWTIEFVSKKGRKMEPHVKLWLDLYMRLAKEYFGSHPHK